MIKAWSSKIYCNFQKRNIGRKFTISNGRIEYTLEVKRTTFRVSKSQVFELPVRITENGETIERELRTSTRYVWTKLYHWRKVKPHEMPNNSDDDDDDDNATEQKHATR